MTHAHQDHYGGLHQLLQRVKAPVLCWQGAVEYYTSFPNVLLRRAKYIGELATRLGIEETVHNQLTSGYDRLARQHDQVRITETLQEGDLFQRVIFASMYIITPAIIPTLSSLLIKNSLLL